MTMNRVNQMLNQKWCFFRIISFFSFKFGMLNINNKCNLIIHPTLMAWTMFCKVLIDILSKNQNILNVQFSIPVQKMNIFHWTGKIKYESVHTYSYRFIQNLKSEPIGPSEVRALPMRRWRRAAWQTKWPLNSLFFSLSFLLLFFSVIYYFSDRRGWPRVVKKYFVHFLW